MRLLLAPLALGAAVAWALLGASARAAGVRAVRGRLPAPLGDPTACAKGAWRVRSAQRFGARPQLVAVAVLAVATAVVAGPVIAVALGAGAAAPPLLRRRRRPALMAAAAVASLPDTIDLLGVAARAGLPAPAAVAGVGSRAPPPWGPALVAAAERTRRGERFGDALGELAEVGGGADAGHPLRALLRSAADDGADLVAGLDRLAADARDLRRRRAEEAARRIPVRLLLPLVACSLPAFALLTIVPIVVGALEALDL